MCHARNDLWTSSELSCLAEPVTPSLVTKDKCEQLPQTNYYHFFSNPKKRGCLLFDALAWPQQLQFESKKLKTILDGFSRQGCPSAS
jgi:hypothetical protein